MKIEDLYGKNQISEPIIIDFYVDDFDQDALFVTLKVRTNYVFRSKVRNHCDKLTYSWTIFGSTSTNQTGEKAFVRFDAPGTYNVMLTVTSRHLPGMGSCIADGSKTKQEYARVVE